MKSPGNENKTRKKNIFRVRKIKHIHREEKKKKKHLYFHFFFLLLCPFFSLPLFHSRSLSFCWFISGSPLLALDVIWHASGLKGKNICQCLEICLTNDFYVYIERKDFFFLFICLGNLFSFFFWNLEIFFSSWDYKSLENISFGNLYNFSFACYQSSFPLLSACYL